MKAGILNLFDFDYKDVQSCPPARFDGPAYSAEHDQVRLAGQILRIYSLMADKVWRTIAEISQATGAPEPSVSAQLRHLRKRRFGAHTINRQPRGDRSTGLFEYQLIVNESGKGGNPMG